LLKETIVGSFLTLYISEGSLATRLRCGGIFNDISLHVYS